MAKFVFVTGGVLSSLGKGITAASLGAIFKAQGRSVIIKKFDPYLNFNPCMMSPKEHGEVFVTEDGGEGDLDLGHYERFIDTNTDRYCDLTSGFVYYNIIEKERNDFFKGKTVQVIPHITDEIKHWVINDSERYDIVLVEIGGTVGDIEGQPFLEAIRQLRFDLGDDNVAYVHVTPLFYVKTAGELKTKPTQHSVQKLREIGITPDMLVCRSEIALDDDLRNKLALFCNVKKEAVVSALDTSPLYRVILNMYKEGSSDVLINKLKLDDRPTDLSAWEELIKKIEQPKDFVTIGVVGKYVATKDAYISLAESICHGGIANNIDVKIRWILADDLTDKNVSEKLKDLDGVMIPAGFGERGMIGKIRATQFARLNDVPFFGLGSMGMQCAIIEYARNVMKIEKADSVEVTSKTPDPIITYIDSNSNPSFEAGAMRVGAYSTKLNTASLAYKIYGKEIISERHRHRLEFNNTYKKTLSDAGMSITGVDTKKNFVDIVELKNHRWFLACQYLPEYKSRPLNPHPLFISFVEEAYKFKSNRDNKDD
ncbi:MAG: CTP synthase [Deferribacteraceae bacterium]|jgi:CTP synthase|nr:CTP synthase [Deferribacteraceae bacterium]